MKLLLAMCLIFVSGSVFAAGLNFSCTSWEDADGHSPGPAMPANFTLKNVSADFNMDSFLVSDSDSAPELEFQFLKGSTLNNLTSYDLTDNRPYNPGFSHLEFLGWYDNAHTLMWVKVQNMELPSEATYGCSLRNSGH